MGSGESLFELRIALVMFGGTSLAVYMNGVVMELLALIRASQQQDSQSDYWPVISNAAAEICIDIISGTSAGGLNALVLAHALATGSDAAGLKELWINTAQLDELLRTEDPHAILSADLMES
ncbi:MAG: hypothetical protein JWN15_639, partial [Firmicutes bacterium]|nr:hypothetical protein [Bacillota bacterium]